MTAVTNMQSYTLYSVLLDRNLTGVNLQRLANEEICSTVLLR